jgi:hypothetical protein
MLYKLIQENSLLKRRGVECDTMIIRLDSENRALVKESGIKDTIISIKNNIIKGKDEIIDFKDEQIYNGNIAISQMDGKIKELYQRNSEIEVGLEKETRRKRIWRGISFISVLGIVIAYLL